MQKNPTLRARITDGKVVWHGVDGKRWAALKKFLEGQEVEITIGRLQKKRSLNQNRYMWGVVYALMAEQAGYTSEEMHEALRRKFLAVHSDDALPTVRSTSDLTTKEMEEYLENCRRLAAEMWGLYVPDPNEANGATE